MMHLSQKWCTAKNVWIPEREKAISDTGGGKYLHRINEHKDIAIDKGLIGKKGRTKKEKGCAYQDK